MCGHFDICYHNSANNSYESPLYLNNLRVLWAGTKYIPEHAERVSKNRQALHFLKHDQQYSSLVQFFRHCCGIVMMSINVAHHSQWPDLMSLYAEVEPLIWRLSYCVVEAFVVLSNDCSVFGHDLSIDRDHSFDDVAISRSRISRASFWDTSIASYCLVQLTERIKDVARIVKWRGYFGIVQNMPANFFSRHSRCIVSLAEPFRRCIGLSTVMRISLANKCHWPQWCAIFKLCVPQVLWWTS